MATVHLICGFLGVGKTTIARKLAVQINAVRLTHDEFMVSLYGRDLPESEFRRKYSVIDKIIWDLAEQIVSTGSSVILDYGFWTRDSRRTAFDRAKIFCENIRFHQVECDFHTAKERLLKRSLENPTELNIDANAFDLFLKKYEPISPDEHYDVIYYRNV